VEVPVFVLADHMTEVVYLAFQQLVRRCLWKMASLVYYPSHQELVLKSRGSGRQTSSKMTALSLPSILLRLGQWDPVPPALEEHFGLSYFFYLELPRQKRYYPRSAGSLLVDPLAPDYH
jgi:hypothetical protein